MLKRSGRGDKRPFLLRVSTRRRAGNGRPAVYRSYCLEALALGKTRLGRDAMHVADKNALGAFSPYERAECVDKRGSGLGAGLGWRTGGGYGYPSNTASRVCSPSIEESLSAMAGNTPTGRIYARSLVAMAFSPMTAKYRAIDMRHSSASAPSDAATKRSMSEKRAPDRSTPGIAVEASRRRIVSTARSMASMPNQFKND